MYKFYGNIDEIVSNSIMLSSALPPVKRKKGFIEDTKEKINKFIKKNPYKVGLGALAVGGLLGYGLRSLFRPKASLIYLNKGKVYHIGDI